jgi:hypothetical protein
VLRFLGGGADRRAGDVIAIDGKTLRRSYQKKGAKAPIHMVSAFATRQRLVLGQVKVADKSNDIVAIAHQCPGGSLENQLVLCPPLAGSFHRAGNDGIDNASRPTGECTPNRTTSIVSSWAK